MEQVTKKKRERGATGMVNIQIHAKSAGIYYGEALYQKVVIVANREPFTKRILQGALGLSSTFALSNQNFPIIAKVIWWTWGNVVRQYWQNSSFISHGGLRFQIFFFPSTGTSNFCPYFLQTSTPDWSDQSSKAQTLTHCLYLQWVPWFLFFSHAQAGLCLIWHSHSTSCH